MLPPYRPGDRPWEHAHVRSRGLLGHRERITMHSSLLRLYRALVIDRPVVALGLVCVLVAFFAIESRHFRLEASSESIVLENDRALNDYRASRERYGSDDFLIVTYAPFEDLWSPASLAHLTRLRDALARVQSVKAVVSILDVPLVNSSKVSIAELSRGGGALRTLQTPGIDRELARKEFLESPIYQNNLVSPDGRTTALQVIFKEDTTYATLLKTRNRLREKKAASGLTPAEDVAFQAAVRAFNNHRASAVAAERKDIEVVRGILDRYRGHAQVYLGGVRMIIADMMSFIEHDLVVFGFGVLVFLVVVLVYFFRKLRWVLLPMSCCLISVIVMVGFLGFLDWPVTVISSNFVSLLLIMTMSLTIHLIVRYRILEEQTPRRDQKTLVFDTIREMTKPCFYTAVTTIVAFGSLIISDIRPVIDFGWMMTIGVTFAFVLNFIYFPAVLVLLKPEQVVWRPDATRSFTMAVARFTLTRSTLIMVTCAAAAVLGGVGIAHLEVENRFIDHFKSTTEIYRGMELIDRKLGGTMPLDFVLDAENEPATFPDETQDMDDPFDDPFSRQDATEANSYWFNGYRLTKIEAIHDYLESLPEVGKVLSLATGLKVFRQLNGGRMPEDYELALLNKYMPDAAKHALIAPYLSADGKQTRVSMRLIESAPTLKRNELIERIQAYLIEDQEFAESNVHPTGMAVLYNNLLQSLYESQILTIAAVFISIFLMFLVFFRSMLLSILAIAPNVLAALSVLGLMGWWGIPLDLMTITIAAITVGIAVDNAIHYVHRFQVEFAKYRTYRETMLACHGSIGRAMYYTSLTVTVGFSILAFSNFIPTIYFGLLTGFAMMVALMGNLTLLAALIVLIKPLGAERVTEAAGGG